MQQAAIHLSNIFQDDSFAWELLNAEIEIEMRHNISGQTIAYLLQLYMRGVQRMNSLADPRQSYFKNKVTSLMTKQTVIKSLKENPMKKKAKHDEVLAKQSPQDPKKVNQTQKTPIKKKSKKQITTQLNPIPQIKQLPQINQLELQQKRRELQMRMAYVAQEHGPDSLKKIIAQQDHREQKITSKISKIINSHEQRLKERINARKLRTATFRTRSEVTMQQSEMMMPNDYEQRQNKADEQFTPFKTVTLDLRLLQSRLINGQNHKEAGKRKHKSLEVVKNLLSPDKRARKYTFDATNTSQMNYP